MSYRQGVVLVLLAGCCWSIMGLVVRLMEAATAWQILFYRSLSLAVFLFLVLAVRSRGRPLETFKRAGMSSLLGGLALVLAFCGSIFAILNTTVANAMFLFATAPFMAALLGLAILKESVRRATWIAMAVGGLGVALMVAEGLALGHLLGNSAALISAFGFALFTVALRWQQKEDMMPAVCLGGFFTAIVAGNPVRRHGRGLRDSAVRRPAGPASRHRSAGFGPDPVHFRIQVGPGGRAGASGHERGRARADLGLAGAGRDRPASGRLPAGRFCWPPSPATL